MSDENTQVADPGVAPAKPAKAERPKRIDFPKPEGGFLEWPAEWDETVHKGLIRSNFKDERTWLRKKIDMNLAQNARYAEEIKQIDEHGPTKRSSNGKLATVTSELTELQQLLAANGIDVAALRAQLEAQKK